MKKAVLILTILVAALPSVARTITVDDAGPADFNNIQVAIDDANAGDTIEIQPGTYTGPSNRNIDFKGKAITVRSTDPNDPSTVAATIIDCNGIGRGFYFHTAEDANSTLRGLTITNGNINGGAGIYCSDSSPLIADCTFTRNIGGVRGIIFCEAFTGLQTTKIVKCNIVANSGVGIYCYKFFPTAPDIAITISDCNITGNSDTGVSRCAGLLTNCTVSGNGGEGGIYSFSGDISNCVISNNSNSGINEVPFAGVGTVSGCTITGNVSLGSGGGIRCSSYGGLITKISNCVISGNSAKYDGGGIYCQYRSPEIVNCLIDRNYSAREGGGIYLSQSDSSITNCTITYNWGSSSGGVFSIGNGKPTATNCVLWGNVCSAGKQIVLGGGSISLSWSDVQGGWPGQGNIDDDPQLTSDYHLASASPCIDAGDPCYASPGGTDIDGEQRVSNGRVDMGADEFIDTDADGLLDWWERKYFGPGLDAQPQGNPDTDDWPNLKEQMHGSDPLAPSDYYVNPTDGNDAWDGLAVAWDGEHGPKKTIQAAVDACPAGQVILAPATYTGDGNRDIDLRGRPIILRSIDPQDPNIVARTIIDAQGSPSELHRGFYLHSYEGAYSAIAGLTITGGYAGGGAIWASPALPTITSCNIAGNRAGGGGGFFGSASSIIDCTFVGNYASFEGGGLLCNSALIQGCIISGNTAESTGGGISMTSSARIADCQITNNTAGQFGGGIHSFACHATVTRCAVTENTSPNNGGAIYAASGSVTVTDSTIWHNSSGIYGNGIVVRGSSIMHNSGPAFSGGSGCVISNSIIAENSGHSSSTSVTAEIIANCTIANNTNIGAGGSGVISNCIIWGNAIKQIGYRSTPPLVRYCNVQGGWPGEGNVDADPHFADPNAADYHLKSQAGRWDANEGRWTIDEVTSPCIDAGDPMTPIMYEPFPNGGIVNMGAYGGTTEASKSYFGEPLCETIVAGDINGDCEVNFLDFHLMALHWTEEH